MPFGLRGKESLQLDNFFLQGHHHKLFTALVLFTLGKVFKEEGAGQTGELLCCSIC